MKLKRSTTSAGAFSTNAAHTLDMTFRDQDHPRGQPGNDGQFVRRANTEPEIDLPDRHHDVYLVATTPEDDAAYLALSDLSAILADHPDARVIGGHMVSLIVSAYPTAGLVDRRTGDADAGIPVALAVAGPLHDALLARGYLGESGNRYVRGSLTPPEHEEPIQPTIDVLIPSTDSHFRPRIVGGRAYDTMPGLMLALSAAPLVMNVNATLRDGTELLFRTRVPPLESAVILKASAFADRGVRTPKDAIDIANLLEVLNGHGAERVGGWRLDAASLTGSRRDAARALHRLADTAAAGRLDRFGIRGPRLAALVREFVGRTD
jgi:hypothetical protein